MIDEKLLTYLEDFVTDKRKSLFKNILANRTRHFTIVLEDIYHQHNASAVIRSCDVFVIQDIYAIENRYTNKVSRHVARGSQKWIDLHRYRRNTNNTEECLKDLKSAGYQIIVTSPKHNSCLLQDFDISKKSAFVFGAEKEGISEHAIQQADGFLKIPMVGFTESLNISVAVAVILQAITVKLRSSDIHWQLSEEEKKTIYFDWIQKTIKNVEKLKEHYFQNHVELK